MVNLKYSKIYNFLKRGCFSINFYALSFLGVKNRSYYFSKWVKDGGDDSLLISYPLNSNSVVFDVGGYTGNFSDKIISNFNPKLYIFEPVKKYYKILNQKYRKNKNVKVFNYGLSNRSRQSQIYLSGDGTSLVKKSSKEEKIILKDIKGVIKKYKNIDLMSVNIEGAEYKLIERLIGTTLIKQIKNLQVQFHDLIPDSQEARKKIIREISKTHKINYSYPFVWESFKLKN